ncbi:MAG: class C sortase [Clostridium sp.]|jgi:sortase A|nr:class C sortase [Clostridium sp.]
MKRETKRTLAAVIIIIVGVAIAAYPFVSFFLNERAQESLVDAYNRQVGSLPETKLNDEFERARAYNDSLSGKTINDPFVAGSGRAYPNNYTDVLDINGDGMMGYLEIPVLKLKLPIYHGTTEEVLKKGVGHIAETALPIGGENTHCVLAAHRGLPSRELFTNIDKLRIGDYFNTSVLGERFYYVVDQIVTVEPKEIVSLGAEDGRDYITLASCTPLGVNSHRLLIRGVRTDAPQQEQTAAAADRGSRGLSAYEKQLIFSAAAAVLIIALVLFFRLRRGKKKSPRG